MSGAIFVCIKNFNARLGDELNLKVDDRIEVLADDSEYNDGWYMGRNVATNKVGLFPKSFTKPAKEHKPLDPTLLRSRLRRLPSGNTPENADKTPAEVHQTMTEIDKALEELQVSGTSLDPQNGHLQQDNPQHSHLRSTSTLLLTQDLNPLQAILWTPKQVSLYFAIVLGFDMDVAGKFARHKITGAILFELDLAHLRELEIDLFGTRFEVYKEIEKLKQINARKGKIHSKELPRLESKSSISSKTEPKDTKPPSRLGSTKDSKELRDSKPPSRLGSTKDSKEPKLGKFDSKETKFDPNFDSKDTKFDPRFDNLNRLNSKLEKLEYKFLSMLDPYDRKLSKSDSKTNSPVINETKGHMTLAPPISEDRAKLLPSVLLINGHKHQRSMSFDKIQEDELFVSPRKAPEPPHSNSPNRAYRFGSPMTPTQGLYMTRTNASSAALNAALLRPALSVYDGSHKRHLSVLTFLSGPQEDGKEKVAGQTLQSHNLVKEDSPKRTSLVLGEPELNFESSVHIDDVGLSPRKDKGPEFGEKKSKDPRRLKSLRSVSTQSFRTLGGLKKLKTSAFTEGIRDINPDDAIKSSNYSGWMSKKSGGTLGWRLRYFTLHGTRLSYFTSLRDKREKGLIDITAHKVIPISTEGDLSSPNDKYIALYAALTGFGRYCFKLVPPAPGFKKGLTFTQPKIHYFAVETQDEMRGWLKALMTATIDIDDTVPVVSSCNTPTVTLAKAQELLAKAREETKLKDDELRAYGYVRDDPDYSYDTNGLSYYNNSVTSDEASPIIDDTTMASSTGTQPKLFVDTQVVHRHPSTPQMTSGSGGFTSPYLLASGLLSPKGSGGTTPTLANKDYFADSHEDHNGDHTGDHNDDHNESSFSEVLDRLALSLGSDKQLPSTSNGRSGGSKKGEKLMAYTSSGSFVIKKK